MKVIRVKNQTQGADVALGILRDKLAQGDKTLGLATGSSPEAFYQAIVKSDLDLSQVTSINLDEYVGLPKESPQSYHYFMEEHLFKYKPMKAHFLPDGQAADLLQAAKDYDHLIEQYGLDLQILGIGRNGHIGFNEPGTDFSSLTHVVDLTPSTIEANSRFFDKQEEVPTQALSMGIASIMSAKSIILFAYGSEKAKAISGMVQGPVSPCLPASVLQNHPDVTVIVDEAAASLLK